MMNRIIETVSKRIVLKAGSIVVQSGGSKSNMTSPDRKVSGQAT